MLPPQLLPPEAAHSSFEVSPQACSWSEQKQPSLPVSLVLGWSLIGLSAALWSKTGLKEEQLHLIGIKTHFQGGVDDFCPVVLYMEASSVSELGLNVSCACDVHVYNPQMGNSQ